MRSHVAHLPLSVVSASSYHPPILLCLSEPRNASGCWGLGHGRAKLGGNGIPTIQLNPLTLWMMPSTLTTTLRSCLALLLLPLRGRMSLQLEVLALRHQLTVYQR